MLDIKLLAKQLGERRRALMSRPRTQAQAYDAAVIDVMETLGMKFDRDKLLTLVKKHYEEGDSNGKRAR